MLSTARLPCRDLPGDVQRQVAGVDHAADEPQVIRHELPGVLHDEHPLDVQLDAPAGLLHPQVVRRAGRDEQQQRVLVGSLDLAVHPGERIGEVAGDVPVEVVVVLVGELALGPGPQRRRPVDGRRPASAPPRLLLGLVSGSPGIRIGRLMWSEYFSMIERSRQPFSRSSSPSRRCSTIVVPRSGRSTVSSVYSPLPSDSQRTPSSGAQAGPPGGQHHPLGHDERRVEADPELADQGGVLALVAGQRPQELPGT